MLFLSFFIPVPKDDAETLEQFAPKHPASFYDGDERG